MQYTFPGEDKLIETMKMLFGDDASACESANTFDTTFSASFVNAEGDNVASCEADIQFASYAGAAFSMLPADVASEFIADGEISSVAKDNLYEVMNIFSALLMNDNTPHLKLKALTDETVDIASTPEEKCYTLTVPGYGEGHVRFNVI
ncbi:MAG: hypothetical protein AAF993_02470 [Pseudomonadota bacterium]